VNLDTNEDSIWVLFDIIQKNFLQLPIRDDELDFKLFKEIHSLSFDAPEKVKTDAVWAVTDLGM
jgi:hypothetical protein